eukprot:CAMPEP_0177197130 /NCGR_PEP_ID=MMETSP0367-20130122/24409_1 /TAXON_ID=447022 ORGANISM="Scrippsiella hangoei-like, Strain SHHI-4" /NCGR_SAMPLE_ID=MMETSP0367 /ASSEMBLY_ACC=CAM_ASM_000362 /LENGTH=45 /DNA_ID= /DNA_START= /DNA_END= /DNA_ORIENTATION=
MGAVAAVPNAGRWPWRAEVRRRGAAGGAEGLVRAVADLEALERRV